MERVNSMSKDDASSSKRHSRNASYNRTKLARRSTKGPLDFDDPLAPQPSLTPTTTTTEAANVPISPTPQISSSDPLSSESPLLPLRAQTPSVPPKDLSFLLQPGNFHPVNQRDIPPPFRSIPTPSASLPTLLSQGHYGAAAVLAANLLTTSPSLPQDRIFSLVYTRLACLTLANQTTLAAQESLVLGDTDSAFYHTFSPSPPSAPSAPSAPSQKDENTKISDENIVPWKLRVLCVRLQSKGYKDLKRGISGYYDLAKSARHAAKRAITVNNAEDVVRWSSRLKDLGFRVGNALIENGDLECAIRHFSSLYAFAADEAEKRALGGRLATLKIKIGDWDGAKKIIDEMVSGGESDQRAEEGDSEAREKSHQVDILKALVATASGDYDLAANQWRALLEGGDGGDNDNGRNLREDNASYAILAQQNLAVCLLYTGQIGEASRLLEDLLSRDQAFPAMTFNLATIYELKSEKARMWKMELAGRVAEMVREESRKGEEDGTEGGKKDIKKDWVMSDFKL
ncbi:MAG: hypothetical protein LQ342_000050 [Letrouitia transgressa]|nr:MAG: hypothetical protein LQ342_000050 [Letrouitia transgressa]